MAFKQDHNVYVGSLLGSVKGLKLDKKDEIWGSVCKNLRNVNALSSSQAITAMAWGDEEQKDVLIGHGDQTVKVFDTEYKSFVSSMKLEVGKGELCGISRIGEALVVAVESGHVKVVSYEDKINDIMDVEGPLSKMKQSSFSKSVIAVGGNEKELQLWDIEHRKCTFTAKNVRHDQLELRVPVWISDIDFLANSNQVVVCSKYGHVRIYDPARQRRPVYNFHIADQVLTACSVSGCGSKVIVGSGTGHMCAVDIRGKGSIGYQYKGCVGSIRGIVCHPFEDLIVSVGLDRFIKLHSINSPELLYKEYLKSKLNCVLVRRDFFYKKEDKEEVDSDCEVIELSDNESDNVKTVSKVKRGYAKLFAGMESVSESCIAKKTKKKSI